jgi:transposase
MKRQWTDIKAIEWRMLELRKAGKTRQEIADELSLEKLQIKNWINRYNKDIARIEAGLLPPKRGRPRKYEESSEKEKDYIIKRLRMENELLRDFLRAAGRK